MKHFTTVLLLFSFLAVQPAQADWRWAKPHYHVKRHHGWCNTAQCFRTAHMRDRLIYHQRIARYNHSKQKEWQYWTHLYIPDCTWYGESGRGPEYAPYRYVMPNQGGSGAYGKFQFMPSTYFNNAKYADWSPLDQEIAVRREYWRHGSMPWSNC